jgi:FkbM family methyltransferase
MNWLASKIYAVKRVAERLSNCSDRWAIYSWSQEGEDQILRRIFEKQKIGFYVDIGAHHPQRFSNTYLFYKRGWRGINIDAMPGSMHSFNKVRPRDTNLELGIAEKKAELDYYIFNESALNGFSRDLSQERHVAKSSYLIKDVIKVDVFPLHEVLDQYLPTGQSIDFMSVDVEGLDLRVLKSNDWNRYRPTFVLAEVLGSSLHEVDQSEIGRFMRDNGYVLYAKCMNTVFFKESLSQ